VELDPVQQPLSDGLFADIEPADDILAIGVKAADFFKQLHIMAHAVDRIHQEAEGHRVDLCALKSAMGDDLTDVMGQEQRFCQFPVMGVGSFSTTTKPSWRNRSRKGWSSSGLRFDSVMTMRKPETFPAFFA